MGTDPAVVAVQVSVMAAEIRHVLALGRRQGAWDAVLCALVVIAAAACCAPVVTQPARFMVLFGVRSAAREHVMPKVQEDVKRDTTALNVPGRGGMNVVMERETSRQTMRRAGGQESVARAECAGCCVEHGDGGLKCATNTVALGCLAPGVINGSVPLYYADSVRFTKCVWDEMDRRGKCVVGRRRDVNFVARECWYFAKVWGRGEATGGARGGSSNVSETAAFKTWKFVEPWAFCMVFLGANCRTYLSQQPSECCATTDGSVGV